MQCNLDARERMFRLLAGLVGVITGALLILLALAGVVEGTWVWWVAAALIVMGGMGVAQGYAGWCVMKQLLGRKGGPAR